MKQEIVRIDLKGVNCYLLKARDNFILIDTAGHTVMDKPFDNRRQVLEEELEKAGCRPGNLKLVVLTHGDNDHTANAAFIRDRYETKIAMHSSDAELVENPDMDKLMKSFQYRSFVNKIAFVLMKKLIQKVTLKTLNDFEKFKPDIFLDDGFSLLKYGFEAEIVYIPGHTSGSIGILTENKDLIAGDIFANIKKPDISPNAYDFKILKTSVGRLKTLGLKTIYPGHGAPFDAHEVM